MHNKACNWLVQCGGNTSTIHNDFFTGKNNLPEKCSGMRGPKPVPILLSERQKEILEKIRRRHSSPQQEVERAQLILTMASGKNNQQAASELSVHRETVIFWRVRWLDAAERLTAAEIALVSDR